MRNGEREIEKDREGDTYKERKKTQFVLERLTEE